MHFLPPLWPPHRKLLPVLLLRKPRLVKLPLFLLHQKPARKMLRLLPHRFLPLRFALSAALWTVLHFSLLRPLLSAVPYFFPLPLLPLMPHFFLPPLLSAGRKPAGFWFCQLFLPPKADFLHRLPDLRAVLLWRLPSARRTVQFSLLPLFFLLRRHLRSGSQADNRQKLRLHTSHSPVP